MRERKLPEELTIIDQCVSTLGKYACALGQHFRPELCYDVIAINRMNGEAIRRHYKTKDEAYAFWTRFKKEITAKRIQSEEEEHDRYRRINPTSSKLN